LKWALKTRHTDMPSAITNAVAATTDMTACSESAPMPTSGGRGYERFAAAHATGAPFTAVVQSLEAHRYGSIAWAAIRAVIQTDDPGGWPVRLTLVLG
jgi:hypothetical protein